MFALEELCLTLLCTVEGEHIAGTSQVPSLRLARNGELRKLNAAQLSPCVDIEMCALVHVGKVKPLIHTLMTKPGLLNSKLLISGILAHKIVWITSHFCLHPSKYY